MAEKYHDREVTAEQAMDVLRALGYRTDTARGVELLQLLVEEAQARLKAVRPNGANGNGKRK